MRIRLLPVPVVVITGLGALAILSGSASATAPAGTTTELVTRATITGGYTARVDGIKTQLKARWISLSST
jgi:hypothetical protein